MGKVCDAARQARQFWIIRVREFYSRLAFHYQHIFEFGYFSGKYEEAVTPIEV